MQAHQAIASHRAPLPSVLSLAMDSSSEASAETTEKKTTEVQSAEEEAKSSSTAEVEAEAKGTEEPTKSTEAEPEPGPEPEPEAVQEEAAPAPASDKGDEEAVKADDPKPSGPGIKYTRCVPLLCVRDLSSPMSIRAGTPLPHPCPAPGRPRIGGVAGSRAGQHLA